MTADLLFRRTGDFLRGDGGVPLIRRAASVFCQETGIRLTGGLPDLRRTEKGKPYFPGAPFDFSLSHSGDLWMCLFTETGLCGLDVQEVRPTDWERIAGRAFRPEEHACVLTEEDFFRFWCRREAFGKLTGEGFFGEFPPLTGGSVTWRGSAWVLTDFRPAPGFFGCLARPADRPWTIREI